ncbi:MAG TPA: T9SS type A sorting domain-containing protein, partial [Bacteroidia bacterium]|nr:T9SS type A sorting domain-containing protein [Bacteroidia bacterium]
NRLEWVTATETNNDYFSLERSRDGLEFSTIARVDGAGNSSQPLHYQYLDTEAGDGLWYYRLRQNDFDGNFSYSDPVALRRGKLKDRFSVYPNPTAGRFTIGLTTNTYAEYEVNVFDALGEVVFSSFETARAAKEISLEHLSAGVYTLLLRCDGEQAAFKLVIER